MSATSRLYIAIFFTGVFSILVVMMGFDKILKMVFGNYIVTVIIIALGLVIDFEIKNIRNSGTSLLGLNSIDLSGLLSNGKMTILLACYIILMVIWYKFSSFNISINIDEIKKRGFMLIITPLCVIGIVLSLLIIIMGSNITNLGRIMRTIPDSPGIRNFVMRIPIRVVLHGIVVLLLSLKIKLSRRGETRFVTEYE